MSKVLWKITHNSCGCHNFVRGNNMSKRFNTTGTCIKQKHYMVNIDKKLNVVEAMVNRGDYFVINRPRQYGKTTLISQLANKISSRYLVIRISFEGIGDLIFSNEEIFSDKILGILADSLEFTDENSSEELMNLSKGLRNLSEVSKALTKFFKKQERKVVLVIDEVDKASNNQLFLSFLGMLRSKFLLATEDLDVTFHSVILAGVHDVKNLKLKLRGQDERKLNSPWNIAVNFNVDMSFNSEEIETMLTDYCETNNIIMDTRSLSDKIYYYTSGYPFLVSRLCQIIHEDILGENNKTSWSIKFIDKAVKEILKENNTLFDDLIKNLENNKDLSRLVTDIVLNGSVITYNAANPVVNIGMIYGVFREDNNQIKLNNRIYEQFIYDYLLSKLEVKLDNITLYNYKNNFITVNNELDFEKILLKFQQFMKEQNSSKDSEFIERQGRLLFLAFIKPIINGVGFEFKEVQISEEKRLDVVVTYFDNKYVAELKIWYGEEYHSRGLRQLEEYLEIQGMDKGYLIVFNFNKNKQYKQEFLKINNKEIFVVYV